MEFLAIILLFLILMPIWLPILGTISDYKTNSGNRIGFPLHNEDKLTKEEQKIEKIGERFKTFIANILD